MNKYIRRKPMSAKQAEVMRIIRAGGYLRLLPGEVVKGRVLNSKVQPVMNIQYRTFYALKSSERIKFKKEILSWVNNPKHILNPDFKCQKVKKQKQLQMI